MIIRAGPPGGRRPNSESALGAVVLVPRKFKLSSLASLKLAQSAQLPWQPRPPAAAAARPGATVVQPAGGPARRLPGCHGQAGTVPGWCQCQ